MNLALELQAPVPNSWHTQAVQAGVAGRPFSFLSNGLLVDPDGIYAVWVEYVQGLDSF